MICDSTVGGLYTAAESTGSSRNGIMARAVTVRGLIYFPLVTARRPRQPDSCARRKPVVVCIPATSAHPDQGEDYGGALGEGQGCEVRGARREARGRLCGAAMAPVHGRPRCFGMCAARCGVATPTVRDQPLQRPRVVRPRPLAGRAGWDAMDGAACVRAVVRDVWCVM